MSSNVLWLFSTLMILTILCSTSECVLTKKGHAILPLPIPADKSKDAMTKGEASILDPEEEDTC